MLRLAVSASLVFSVLLFSGVAASFAADEHHNEKGPHKGSLVELGDEEYHAEIVHDEKGSSPVSVGQ